MYFILCVCILCIFFFVFFWGRGVGLRVEENPLSGFADMEPIPSPARVPHSVGAPP